jgi:hypothetical protein
LESAIPDDYNQCVFIRYYTIRRRVFIPTVLKAGAGPHQLPKGGPGNDNASEEIPLVLSEDDSMEVDYQEAGSSDTVTHNVPLVGLERYPHLPLLTNWIKDDRDGFDVVAEFIFQVGASSQTGSCSVTYSNRGPTRGQYYYIITTFRTSSRYASVFVLVPRSP